ncbi:hypothetical protein HOLleu_23198 [Holothuria leucospilota]|uniref:Uncharacterized protein n=1 Tax=Holothuria leucospilota TaxID=206669 RepID=A0A9Q1BUT8_HOLLE|nr:hypothetical protein HOLleu_23198 [Holothuria leucospilota]
MVSPCVKKVLLLLGVPYILVTLNAMFLELWPLRLCLSNFQSLHPQNCLALFIKVKPWSYQ